MTTDIHHHQPATAAEATSYLRRRLPLWQLQLADYTDERFRFQTGGYAQMLSLYDAVKDEASWIAPVPDCPSWSEYIAAVGAAWQLAKAWSNAVGIDATRRTSGATADAVRAILGLAEKVPAGPAPAIAPATRRPTAAAV